MTDNIDPEKCWRMHESLLDMWSELEHHKCHHRRALGELLGRCAHALLIFYSFKKGESMIGELKASIMECVARSDILKCQLDDVERRLFCMEYEE